MSPQPTPDQLAAFNWVTTVYQLKIDTGELPPSAWPFVHWTPLYHPDDPTCECGVVWVMLSGAN